MAGLETALRSKMGVADGMFAVITMRKLIVEGKGSIKSTYGDLIALDQTVATITHEPSTSEASLALNGGVVRTSKTGLGSLTMTVTAINQDVLKELMIGIKEDPETGALQYDFSNMTGNRFQVSYGETFSSGITRCYKFMNVKPSLPGSTVNATDPENTNLAANGTINLSPETGASGEGAMFTKDFKSDDVEGITAFLTEPYPPKIIQSNLEVSSISPSSGNTISTDGTVEVTFNKDVTDGIAYYVEVMSASDFGNYTKVNQEELDIKVNELDKKKIQIKHKTAFSSGNKLLVSIKAGAQAANGDSMKNTVVATYTVS